MHIGATFEKSKATPSDKRNNGRALQKHHPLMLFENNDILQKWHMISTPPKIDKYDTHRKWHLTKMAQLGKNFPKVICQGLSWVIFKSEFFNC